MGNCCGAPPKTPKPKKGKKPNPFSVEYSRGPTTTSLLTVLTNPTGRDIGSRHELGQELGRGEFGVTYLCTDREGGENLACKSISKKKLRTAVDIVDVRREVDIMRHLPHHPNIVTLKDTYEDGVAVHLVMELCEGGELFDRIVARGHYTERTAAGITRTVVEVVQLLGCEFRMIHTAFPPPLPSTSATILNDKFTKTLRDLHQHHALAIKTGLIHDPLVAAELLRASALSNARDLSYARNIFDQIPQPNCFSWNTIIHAFAESDESPSYAITLFCHMLLQEPVQPNQFTFPSVLKACARTEAIKEGEQIHAHAHAVKVGFGENEFVLTNLVRMCALCGRTEDARRLVENGSISPMNEANIVLYNTMIDGYFRLGMIVREAYLMGCPIEAWYHGMR